VRFLEIDEAALKDKLRSLGAVDHQEDFLREMIFYDQALHWQTAERKFVRIRQTQKGTFVTFKHNEEDSATGTKEIEFKVDSSETEKVKNFLEEIGLVMFREQEKKRHSFDLQGVLVELDTWPEIPTYVELEGPSEEALKQTAAALGLDWANVVFDPPRYLIEQRYHIPVSDYRFFTFKKIGN